ncbi:uncharacterized protein LOC135471919 [Liolophura sinensis]|uniref:uncharacterized protein LOC135471919 n=1 Tax=Liolophura sinensis TaxID=3198878 RepID=UPI0031584E40
MKLKWSPPDCQKLTSFPSSYTVSYGAADTTTENSSAQCDSVAAMLQTENVCLDFPSGTVCKTSLESLKSGQMYFVCVHGISDDKSGKWVFRRAHTPDNTNLGLIVGLCIGGTVLIGIIIICCRLFWLSQNKKNDFTYPEAFRPLPDLESSYYAEINGYHTVSTEICNGESPIHTGYGNIPNGVAHHSTNGGFNILSVECPDSPGPGSSGPGSTAPGSTESGSPVPLLFPHQLPQGDLQEQISDASSNPNVSSQDLTRNNLPDRVSPEVGDSPGSDLSEDNVLPGPADSCSAGDTQLQTPGEHSQDRGETEEPSYDTDEEYDDTDWTDESDQYKKPKMAQTEDFDVFQDSSSSLQGKEMSGSTTELLTKHRAAEEGKDLVGKDNFGGPASRSNSMTSYARLSSVRQGTSTSDSSSDHTVPFPTKTRVTEEELVKQKALERHRAGVEETETRTEQTSV